MSTLLAFTPQAPPKDLSEMKWYAALAMQSMILKQGIPESESAREEIALWSFRMAEEMIATDRRLHSR